MTVSRDHVVSLEAERPVPVWLMMLPRKPPQFTIVRGQSRSWQERIREVIKPAKHLQG